MHAPSKNDMMRMLYESMDIVLDGENGDKAVDFQAVIRSLWLTNKLDESND